MSRSPLEQLDNSPSLNVIAICDSEVNTLVLRIEELSLSSRTDYTPPVADAVLREHDVGDPVFEVQWPRYVAYSVRNESYTAWDDYEEFTGRRLRVYTKSRFLDYVRSATGPWGLSAEPKHWGVVCENHVVDVMSDVDPQVTLLRVK